MHPKKSLKWRNKRYFGRFRLESMDRWMFGDMKSGRYILKYSMFKIVRHVLVKGKASPDDPNLKEYWEGRNRELSREHVPSYQKVAKKQDYKCLVCEQSLFNYEELHLHHKIPRSKGGTSSYANLSLVHLYCHQQIHADASYLEEDWNLIIPEPEA